MTVENFEETVTRENEVSKMTGLLNTYPYFLKEMQINEELHLNSKEKCVNILNPQIVKYLSDVSFFIAIIQNMMILTVITR